MNEDPIVVGIDGSDGARHALSWAVAQAKATDRPIILVHGFFHPTLMVAMDDAVVPQGPLLEATEELKTYAEQELHGDWAAPLEGTGIAFTSRLVQDHPGAALVEVASGEHAALVVVGSRGLGEIRGSLLGSVSNYVVHHSKFPVAVIPNKSPD